MSDEECPVVASRSRLFLNILLLALGVIGLYYLSIWASVAFFVWFVIFFFVIMPVKACRYCYFKVDATVEQWKDQYLPTHEDAMKKWGSGIFTIWIIPIVGIVASFFKDFSYVAVICLVGFVLLVLGSSIHLNRTICSGCAISEICPMKHSHT